MINEKASPEIRKYEREAEFVLSCWLGGRWQENEKEGIRVWNFEIQA